MRMKKAGLAVSIGLLAFTAACSSGGNTTENSPANNPPEKPVEGTDNKPQETGKKVKLSYWTGDRHDQEYITEVIKSFNASNADNIEVELVVKTDDFNQAIDLAFASGQAPDLIRVKENTIQPWVKKGYLEPIDGFLTDELKAKFPVIPDFNQIEGKIYSLPNYGSTLRLVYNKDLFAKAGVAAPPKTLDELVETAKKLTEAGKAEGAYGFALNFKSTQSAMFRSARVIAEANGDGGFGYDFKTARYDWSSYKPIIEAFKKMVDDGSTMPGMESLDIDPLRAQFAEGKIGMYISFSSEPGVYQNQFPAKIDWAAAPVPTTDGQVHGKTSFTGGQWLAINAQSKNKEAAWKFMQYMYGDDILKTYQEKGFGLSMVPSITASAAKPSINGIEGFMPTENDGTWPLDPTSAIKVEGIMATDAFFKYMLSGGNLDEIVNDLNKRYNDALDQAIAAGEVTAEPDPAFDPMTLK
ncbi:multiple sugar transport system substrate-binding protein [Paenibacillus phyllosphaerae]|uniref:Multiple sugar transport system substrate-binding protein n=1 Tax=Paenibacillus phyllosphaerae TaxID=274593 RepID=A0A7W5B075_9BACL|nr:sugar ABC transporter substrate-binding protein [Paenibacillus phyllosphaerae]MBB3111511.1 multiple sugar transport system substrate-binding protein [Paenibacillus phyllosphaerae]